MLRFCSLRWMLHPGGERADGAGAVGRKDRRDPLAPDGELPAPVAWARAGLVIGRNRVIGSGQAKSSRSMGMFWK